MTDEIWKYLVQPGDFTLEMQEGAKVLSVQMQHGLPVMWALVDSCTYRAPRQFVTVGTGHRFEPDGKSYVGTWQDGGLVWHLWEVTND